MGFSRAGYAALMRAGAAVESGNNSVVECDLAKVEVAGSNPVSRSNFDIVARCCRRRRPLHPDCRPPFRWRFDANSGPVRDDARVSGSLTATSGRRSAEAAVPSGPHPAFLPAVRALWYDALFGRPANSTPVGAVAKW
jgi:hypothetical protein